MEFLSQDKQFGVLLPVSALSSNYGIGELGPFAFDFIDWLKESGASFWQVLPTTIADPKSGCPYSSMSAFGGYPELISIDLLVSYGLIEKENVKQYEIDSKKVNYKTIHPQKMNILEQSYKTFLELDANCALKKEFNSFCKKNSSWCFDLSNFLTLSSLFGDKWWLWPSHLRDYKEFLKNKDEYQREASFHLFNQFIFDKQWSNLKTYANDQGISLIGDIPIFISHHSMDLWKKPSDFKLNRDFTLKIQTGVPADDFSEDGQCWSTPNYNWDEMQKLDFTWWKERFSYTLKAFDIIRFDHFIGLVNVFEIPATDTNAKKGAWIKTPGEGLLKSLFTHFKSLPMIVEDLGEKTAEVENLKNQFNLPGMKILMFAYDGKETNEHLPQNYQGNEVVYTGTHDNNTIIGHFTEDISKEDLIHVKDKLDLKSIDNINWELINESFKSKAPLAILPIQDLLDLGEEGRFNIPGTVENNWSWRLNKDSLSHKLSNKIFQMAKKHGRVKLKHYE